MSKIELDLETVFEAIESKDLVEEVRERLANGDAEIEALSGDFEDDEPLIADDDEDRFFRPLDDWTRAELLKAIREDDGRRAIDVLKRCAA